ncbi:MAG: 1-acyl-sn-glycerol-3-phosphate acyltransferase [candidate division KSB1 bacterium]|nr:1-acyl-sn-glycerol-3-phosphate acyltransferase [candidate division KSB1 bacterium]MDZ7369145.1 1-acyl-sn-glycerol-3-phosphate acyltransferase [candidate division KSB1 bacterium]MDZ7407092.1 1-acyl-sn-glycerol-3-phosphate acyltransferase [candidate division KSB1 bacterium]
MRTFRLCYRLLLLVVGTIVLEVILLIGKPFLCFAAKWRIRWRNLLVQTWARMVALIVNMKVHARGRPPKPPFYLVSNHLGYFDVPAYFTQLHCIFVAKAELANWPFLGFLAKSANTLFIDRSNKKDIPRLNALIEKAIHESDGVIVFPESTSSKGSEILPFKSPLLEYPAIRQFPVSYATIHYRTGDTDPPAYLSVCWWGEMTFAGHFLELLKLSRIDATITFGPTTVRGDDRKKIAQELWDRLNRQFEPTFNPQHESPVVR